jgi:MoaA/NifB/PqqE/SkfB family radical SAM enzyme
MLFKNLRLTIGLTDKCNLRCIHCLRNASSNKSGDLPLDLLEKILKEGKELGVRHINLTGGEVGLHSDFDKATELIVKNGYTFSIVTNGNNPEYYTNALTTYRNNALTFIAVSIDGSTDRTYRSMRGGDFAAACKSLRMFGDMGYYTKLICCINRKNYHEFDNIIKLAQSLKVNEVVVLGLIVFDHNNELALTNVERNNIIDKCKLINKNYKNIRISWCTSLGEMNRMAPVVDFCSNLQGFYPFVRANGDCEFCCDAEGTFLGSLKDSSLLSIAERYLGFSNYMRMDRYKKIVAGKYKDISSCNYCIETYKDFVAEKKRMVGIFG